MRTKSQTQLYSDAIEFIALNDTPAPTPNVETIAQYFSVALVASIFGLKNSTVAEAVVRRREELSL